MQEKKMHRLVAFFLGRDCPGMVSTVATIMDSLQCSIVNVSQTAISGEFAGIFTVDSPQECDEDTLRKHLQIGLDKANIDLSIIVRQAAQNLWGENKKCEIFVVSVSGQDRKGIISGMSGVFSRHGVNIVSLRAVLEEENKGHALVVFEVMVPDLIEMPTLRRELVEQGERLDLRVSVQHRDIFEAVNRVLPV